MFNDCDEELPKAYSKKSKSSAKYSNNNLENPEILSPVVLNAIDYLLLKNPNFIFGGSLALNAVGIIKRPIKDIDIVIEEGDIEEYDINGIVKKNPVKDECYETSQEIAGNVIKRYPASIHEVKVCFFVDKKATYSNFEFSGRSIRINSVNDIIIAKQAYLENPGVKPESFLKHMMDINTYKAFIKSYFLD
jgi:hypothetical protein